MQVGENFGQLTFIKRTVRVKYLWKALFSCSCGGEIEAYMSNVKKGSTRSCGCAREHYKKNPVVKKHGMSSTGVYSSWMNMMYRCNNPNATGYESYGGRGIKVCDEWHKFENFYQDMKDRPNGMTIDRIDTNGNYEPSNCRWASKPDQAKNCRKDRVSSSMYKGVSFNKSKEKWESYININGKRIRIGYYKSEIEAFEAYKAEHERNFLKLPMYLSR